MVLYRLGGLSSFKYNGKLRTVIVPMLGYYKMFKKMTQYLAENGIENLYTMHLSGKTHSKIYSLTRPILKPEAEVTTFFDKPSYQYMSDEERMIHKLTNQNKSNTFGKSFGSE